MDELFKLYELMIRVPHVQVQHAMIDTGSDVTLVSQAYYPAQHWKDLKYPIQILVASG